MYQLHPWYNWRMELATGRAGTAKCRFGSFLLNSRDAGFQR
jgi:hypothetical protein